MDANEIRKNFEDRAYRGYVSQGIVSSDGYYAPIDRDAFVRSLRMSLPLSPDSFVYDTDFRPTEDECNEYNETFRTRPEELRLAIKFTCGWRSVAVTGTRHAHQIIGEIAETRKDFEQARLEDVKFLDDGYYAPVITTIPARFVTDADVTGSYARLLRDSDTAELV